MCYRVSCSLYGPCCLSLARLLRGLLPNCQTTSSRPLIGDSAPGTFGSTGQIVDVALVLARRARPSKLALELATKQDPRFLPTGRRHGSRTLGAFNCRSKTMYARPERVVSKANDTRFLANARISLSIILPARTAAVSGEKGAIACAIKSAFTKFLQSA